jgi:hypothetical protein
MVLQFQELWRCIKEKRKRTCAAWNNLLERREGHFTPKGELRA